MAPSARLTSWGEAACAWGAAGLVVVVVVLAVVVVVPATDDAQPAARTAAATAAAAQRGRDRADMASYGLRARGARRRPSGDSLAYTHRRRRKSRLKADDRRKP